MPLSERQEIQEMLRRLSAWLVRASQAGGLRPAAYLSVQSELNLRKTVRQEGDNHGALHASWQKE
jgi:hypothetical protein